MRHLIERSKEEREDVEYQFEDSLQVGEGCCLGG